MGKQRSRRSQRAVTVPLALTIAGSDCSAGAGIQADLKTFTALGVYGLTAVTCIVAEVPRNVSRIEPVTARMVREQIEVLLKNFRVGAIKTGLLCSAEIVCAVAQTIQDGEKKTVRSIPFVVDPVMIATSGDNLLGPEAVESYKNKLFPLATLITPNLDEAALLLETTIIDRKQMENAAKALAKKYRASILLKGGHLQGDKAIDLLFHNGELTEFSAPFVRGVETHGTGCTYSAAIAASLAFGFSLEQAIKRAKKFVTESIALHLRWKRGSTEIDALNHSM
ncbi:MAG: bifunctional hydroxymethylpyrimidine kinase/phosphomethylpyrimidine kinase [Verrucomicrobia bacterium]|nr:MAG: bifunctional hydroxymethylpyrimidine kinase/phosphomethylpyrimidine kinase [Verrucomicrobiota bacterium]